MGLNLGAISMLIEFILVAKYNFYIVKKLLWKFIYKEKVVKDSLQWKNDLGLYFTLVLVMKIGMCDLMIFRLV